MTDHAAVIPWEERIRLAVVSFAHWYQLPDAPRVDRVFKESGVQ